MIETPPTPTKNLAEGAAHEVSADAISELASTGKLRVGVVFAPAGSTFFVAMDAQAKPHGVTVALGQHLAAMLGVQAEFLAVPNSGELTDAVEKGRVDVAFMPVDEERLKRVAFGPSYFLIESTGLVHGWSHFKSTRDLDRPGVIVAGIANTTTIRSAARVLPLATVIAATSVEEAMDLLKQKRADAVALSRDVLSAYQAKIPGLRVLEGHLHATGIAIAVAKGRPEALAVASAFLGHAKSSGLVRQLFDRFGFQADAVASA